MKREGGENRRIESSEQGEILRIETLGQGEILREETTSRIEEEQKIIEEGHTLEDTTGENQRTQETSQGISGHFQGIEVVEERTGAGVVQEKKMVEMEIEGILEEIIEVSQGIEM